MFRKVINTMFYKEKAFYCLFSLQVLDSRKGNYSLIPE